MSDTPRTDAKALTHPWINGEAQYVTIEFARELEIENAALEAQIERDAGQPGSFARCQKLEHENETLRKSMKSITPFLAELVKVFDYAQTNGDLFDLADVCIKYRDAIDAARKETK